MFVNLTDFLGSPVELVMEEYSQESGITNQELGIAGLTTETGIDIIATPSVFNELPDKKQKILVFLNDLKEQKENSGANLSEVFTDRVSASTEVISPQIITDILYAKKIFNYPIPKVYEWQTRHKTEKRKNNNYRNRPKERCSNNAQRAPDIPMPRPHWIPAHQSA